MILHLDKEQRCKARRRLLTENRDIVFILYHDALKQMHKDGKTQLSAVESFLSARQFAQTLLSIDEVMEGLEDEIDDLVDEADSEDDAMIICSMASAIIMAYAKSHPKAEYEEVAKSIIMRWVNHPLFMPMLLCAAKKEEKRFAENKRNNLLTYELEQATSNNEGDEAVREIVHSMVEIAKENDSSSTKEMLIVLSRFNDNNGHRFQKEIDALYEIHKRKQAIVEVEMNGNIPSNLNFKAPVGQVIAHADVVERNQ